VREYAHTQYGYPEGRVYDAAAGAAQLGRAARAGALSVPAYAATSSGVALGTVGHIQGDRGIHFNDEGRMLLAQLVLNALALRLGGARRRAGGGGGGGGGGRRWRHSRGKWPNSTTTPRPGYCETTASEGDCGQSSKGYWQLARHGIHDLAQCVARCHGCAHCRYVSFSWAHDECAWFSHCRLPLEQAYQGDTYQTLQVAKSGRRDTFGGAASW